ncbi:RAS guanyl-releasing protein 2-like, partial [Strigops habroptila]|uniref:RAS guanyl-releasing protein 2-like n=1 Tax=Strigops habroptila TaxID=2489341 RepID=UPI0011CF593D
YWVRAFPAELAGDAAALGRLGALRDALRGDGPDPGIDLEAVEALGARDGDSDDDDGDTGDGDTGDTGDERPLAARHKRSLLLEQLPPPALAALLTRMEQRTIARVRVRDYRSFARRGGAGGSPALRRVVALSNAESRWAQLLVLGPTAAPQRARAIARLLQLGQSLLELRNFNSLLAVVGGLGHGSITRLRQTLALLPPPVTQRGSRLAEAVAAGGNYRRYRALLAAGGAAGGAVPALGVHLRDLVSLEAALPDWGGPARPHPHKLRQRFAILRGLLGAAAAPPEDRDLLRLLRVSLALSPTEAQLYELSLQREPRTSAGPPLSLPPVVPMDEWLLPEPPRPDPARLRPQLERLVERIFQDFDVDGDGRISREEFAIVGQSFPQLRLWGELDTDRDGSLTREEVLAYFLRCSEGPPPGPPHCFVGSSPLRPTACSHCARTIWGLHRPGLKCRSCGLRCHAGCRDSLRARCRPRGRSVTSDPPARDPPAPSPAGPPEELQELQDGVFDVHL